MTPVSAEAAAVTRRAEVDRVVLRAAAPGEVAVERAQALRAGGRHVADARAGAAGRLGDGRAGRQQIGSRPSRAIISRMRWLPGKTHERHRRVRRAGRAARRRTAAHVVPRAVRARADHRPARSACPRPRSTGTTRSGEPGSATSGSSASRSSSIWSSYSASGSAASGASRPRGRGARKYARVTSSDGKTLVVSASSAPMLQIVARWGSESVAAPGPPYSKILPMPPRTV